MFISIFNHCFNKIDLLLDLKRIGLDYLQIFYTVYKKLYLLYMYIDRKITISILLDLNLFLWVSISWKFKHVFVIDKNQLQISIKHIHTQFIT